MAGTCEFSKDRFLLRDDGHEWSIDRGSRRVRVVRRSFLGRSTDRAFPLDDLMGVTLQLLPAPAMTAAAVMGVLRTAFNAYQQGISDPDDLAGLAPGGLAVRLDEAAAGAPPRETTMNIAVQGLVADRDLITLAYRIADVAGLRHAGVFSMPHAGAEVRLARAREPRLEPLPAMPDDITAGRAAADALGRAGMPPFEPHRFRSDHDLAEWNPGHRVLFRRRFSAWAVAVFPLTLLLLTGPAIVAFGLITGRELNVVNTLILSVVSLAFGIPGTALFLAMLPRSVDFDWQARMLSIRRWPRHRSVPLARILALEALPRYDDSSSGDGGGSSRSYTCELRARIDERNGAGPRTVDLLETRAHEDPAVPTRQAFPLASELAAALHVDCRIEGYSFRRAGGKPGARDRPRQRKA